MRLPDASSRVVGIACFLLVGALQLRQLELLETRRFNPDELQHVHAAWCTHVGLLPYRDYFDPHAPLFRLAAAPFFGLFAVETSGEDAVAFLRASRRAMWMLTAVILALTFRLARLWRGPAAGWIALVLLVSTSFFRDKTIEIRPDVPALAFWLCCLVAILLAVRRPRDSLHGRLAGAGLLFGLSLSLNVKMLLALPAVAVLAFPGSLPVARDLRERMHAGAWLVVGLAFPLLVLGGWFWWLGILGDALHQTLFVAIFDWQHRVPVGRILFSFLRENPLITAAGVSGLVVAALRVIRQRPATPEDRILVASALVPIAALPWMPEPWPQYFLLFLPALSILGAGFLLEATRMLPMPRLAALGAVLLAVAPGAFGPARQSGRNDPQLREIRYVVETTGAADSILNGWGSAGLFRRHAYVMPFLPRGFLVRLTREDRAAILRDLESCRMRPALVFLDGYVRSLSPAVEAYLETSYEPTGVGRIWRRKKNCAPPPFGL